MTWWWRNIFEQEEDKKETHKLCEHPYVHTLKDLNSASLLTSLDQLGRCLSTLLGITLVGDFAFVLGRSLLEGPKHSDHGPIKTPCEEGFFILMSAGLYLNKANEGSEDLMFKLNGLTGACSDGDA